MSAQESRADTPRRVTTGPIGGSRKSYSSPPGAPGLKVPYRELELHEASGGEPLRIYNSSGPYGCSEFAPDLEAGLPVARPWLAARAGLRSYEGREVKPEDNGFASGRHLVPPCPAERKIYGAAGGAPVTQLDYARAGIITAEMEYVAHPRESLAASAAR